MLESALIGSTLPDCIIPLLPDEAVGWRRELLAAEAFKEVAEAAGVEDMDLAGC